MSGDDFFLVVALCFIAIAINTCGLTDSIDGLAAAVRAQKCGKP